MGCMGPNSTRIIASPAGIFGQTDRHPCYSYEAHRQYARMHLPVAPRCNIGCNYCNRKYDCVNESRPGVTSEVLSPTAARDRFKLAKAKLSQLSVVGIAGPGDALADWARTKQTLKLIRQEDNDIIFCLSTNGLMLPTYAPEIVQLGVNHVTVTVNCLDPAVGAQIYKFAYYRGKKYQGQEAAKILIANQLAGIQRLAALGAIVKVNIVMIHDINEAEIPMIAKQVKTLGAFIVNIMPLIPAPGSAFAHFPRTSARRLNEMRDLCQADIRQMRHCRQCRADAVGLLSHDISDEFRTASSACLSTRPANKRYKIAVTSKCGKLVDQHFGQANEFLIYETDGGASVFLEKRSVRKYCVSSAGGDVEAAKNATIDALRDCDAVLTMRIGLQARQRLLQQNIVSIEHCYTIEAGLAYAAERLAREEARQEKVNEC